MPSVLFVCTANRFRSPIAAACFARELTLHKLPASWHVSSAGTWTQDGLPAIGAAVLAARRIGLDIRGHAARGITAQMVQDADLILVMEQGHKEALRSEFPAAAGRIHILSEMAGALAYDIPDTQSPAGAAEVATEIADLVRSGFDRICALAQQERPAGAAS